ncbi:hypothetical protein [Mucilaginibacter sp.]|nr:hypothetical protein [Mucilaginibacter sp.]
MNNCNKLNLEWIPNAYAAVKEKKQKEAGNITETYCTDCKINWLILS